MLQDSQIGVDLCHDSGATYLQDYRRAAGERGPMYLRDRGSGIGFALKIGKHFGGRPAERLFDLRQEVVERYRRHMTVQPVEFIGPRRRQKVFSCREDLTQLDEGRPELLQGEPGALLRFEMRDFTGLSPLQYLAGALEQRRDAGPTHELMPMLPAVPPITARAISLTASGSIRPSCRAWVVNPFTRSRIAWSSVVTGEAASDVLGSGMHCSMAVVVNLSAFCSQPTEVSSPRLMQSRLLLPHFLWFRPCRNG